jgi:hypothetical protein
VENTPPIEGVLFLIIFVAIIAFLVWQARNEKRDYDYDMPGFDDRRLLKHDKNDAHHSRKPADDDKNGDGDFFDVDYD